MRHLFVCRDYPPAPSGGIGIYTWHITRLLAEAGETVHVMAQQWKGAEQAVETDCSGRLVIHRIPFVDWHGRGGWHPHPALENSIKLIHESCPSPSLLFGWQACAGIERLVEEEAIDLIEASEYEAPLYRFMLRRALHLGPRRQPPCIIHLHSPTELLAQFNDEDALAPSRHYAIRHEEYCLRAADALLSPSQAMKHWAVERYGFRAESIAQIPLPVGATPYVERPPETWRNGSVAFLGRLQPCKGVFEFARAASQIAKEHPEVVFDVIGGDTAYLAARHRSVYSLMQNLIPRAVRGQFRFRGEVDRKTLLALLGQARIGVVPSRWENFPNACLEIMASGLPVVAMPHGGLPEIVRDGHTGWLAEASDSEALAQALRQAIETPADDLAAKGVHAREHVAALCNNEDIVQRHLALKREIAGRPPALSIAIPPHLPRQGAGPAIPRRQSGTGARGIGVAIPCYNQGGYLRDCLSSLVAQTVAPVAVVVVDDGSDDPKTLHHLRAVEKEGWRVLHKPNGGLVSARNAGIQQILEMVDEPLGIVCIDSDDRLRPEFIERCAHVLEHCPEAGVVSCWVRHFEAADRIWMQPCPGFPYQWTTNEVATFSAVRTQALLEVGLYQLAMHQGCYSDWDLFNAVLAAGWVGVTIPEILGEYRVRDDSILRRLNAHAHGRMRRAMFERFPELVAADAIDVALLSEAADSWILREEVFTLRAQVARARSFLRRPDRAMRWLGRKVSNRLRRMFNRWPG